jgi:chromosomal replication initiator protein
VDYHDDELVIGAPNQIQLQRVQQRYLPLIIEQARQIVGKDVRVSLTISDQPTTSVVMATAPESTTVSSPSTSFALSVDRPARLDPRMTFDSFVPGSSNRLAFAAAQSVAETPGRAYNPQMM